MQIIFYFENIGKTYLEKVMQIYVHFTCMFKWFTEPHVYFVDLSL
jgi:hypothetical protein